MPNPENNAIIYLLLSVFVYMLRMQHNQSECNNTGCPEKNHHTLKCDIVILFWKSRHCILNFKKLLLHADHQRRLSQRLRRRHYVTDTFVASSNATSSNAITQRHLSPPDVIDTWQWPPPSSWSSVTFYTNIISAASPEILCNNLLGKPSHSTQTGYRIAEVQNQPIHMFVTQKRSLNVTKYDNSIIQIKRMFRIEFSNVCFDQIAWIKYSCKEFREENTLLIAWND